MAGYGASFQSFDSGIHLIFIFSIDEVRPSLRDSIQTYHTSKAH